MLAVLALPPILAAPIDQKRYDLDHPVAILIRTRLTNPSLLCALILVGRVALEVYVVRRQNVRLEI